MTNKNHFLIIGPLLAPDGSNLGGATVSLNYLVKYLQQQHYAHDIIDTQYYKKGWKKILNPMTVLWSFFTKIRKTDIVFVNVSQFGTKTIAPLLFVLTKICRRKFIFRPFGGAMRDHYEKYPIWQKWLFDKTLLQSDIFFLQTKALIHFFQAKGKRVEQLPTSRYQPPTAYLRPHRPYQKRFVFLGHVNAVKGIDYLLEAIERLDASFTVHIYGPIHEEKYRQLFEDNQHYQGLLKKEQVLPTLQQYDVLVLPTHYRGEGYPGAIIEAYSLGLPVITTQWRAIPEIVEDGETGLVISPQSTVELVEAMQRFDKDNYPIFSENTRRYFNENFDAEVVNKQVMDLIGSRPFRARDCRMPIP